MVDNTTENNLGDADINIIRTNEPKLQRESDKNLFESSSDYDFFPKFSSKLLNSTATAIITFYQTLYNFFFIKEEVIEDKIMSCRRSKHPEPLGPVYIIRSIRDQIGVLQEKRGISADENNFINLLSVIIQQSGHAMYAVFTMFLALLPAGAIIIHTLHFMLDKLLDVMTTRKRKDLWFKGSVFILQLIFICIVIHFVFAAIFAPIFAMQTTIVSKILFMDEPESSSCPKSFTFQNAIKSKGTAPKRIKPPIATPLLPPPSVKDIVLKLGCLKSAMLGFVTIAFNPF